MHLAPIVWLRYRRGMLSYQHAYHAGNPADLHKHAILAGLLAALTRKPRGITYMESHAGRGLYDLSGPEAQKTGEAAQGIAKATLPEGPYARALAQVRERYGTDAYPGSPLIAQALLRDQDRLHLMELHPAEFASLKANAKGPNVSVHRRDGYEGVLALSPPDPRRGMVLVDPSYEVKSEYDDAAAFVRKLIARWPQAVVMLWYPILPAGRHRDLVSALSPLGPLIDEAGFKARENHRMTGSGVALINAPYGADQIIRAGIEAAPNILKPLR